MAVRFPSDFPQQHVFRFIAQRRAQPGRGGDLLSILLATVDAETGEQMSNQQLRDEAVSMFLAGHETTSVALAWALHFLVENPDLLQALAAEVDAALGDRRPAFADVPRLPLALAAVHRQGVRAHGRAAHPRPAPPALPGQRGAGADDAAARRDHAAHVWRRVAPAGAAPGKVR
ncbi:cytochrome P450 [Sorangium sp. So ce128]